MKKIYLILLIIFFNNILALEAYVESYRLPLLKEPKLSSTVYQYIYHGQKVYIPEHYRNLSSLPDFIETYDRAGNLVYIPKKYLKVIDQNLNIVTNDKLKENDPTDYRIEEPIPQTYPYNFFNYTRTNISFTIGSNMKSPYQYSGTPISQKYASEKGMKFIFQKRVNFENEDRYYFGLFTSVGSVINDFEFKNGDLSRENRSMLRIGPYFSYDFFKNYLGRISIGTGMTYNYHKTYINYMDSTGNLEQRLFSSFTLSPFVNFNFTVDTPIPNTEIVFGNDLTMYFAHKLAGNSDTTLNVWNEKDISEKTTPQSNFYIGVQVNY